MQKEQQIQQHFPAFFLLVSLNVAVQLNLNNNRKNKDGKMLIIQQKNPQFPANYPRQFRSKFRILLQFIATLPPIWLVISIMAGRVGA